MMRYPASFKAKMVQRMSGADALSASALAEETGLSQPTLSRWLREASSDKVSTMKKKRPRERSARERLALLVQADWLPSQAPLWDTSAALPENSPPGQLLYALLGYEATPGPWQVGLSAGALGLALLTAAAAARTAIFRLGALHLPSH